MWCLLYTGQSSLGNVMLSPLPQQNNQSKMLWSLSRPSSTRLSAGLCYRLHDWQDWRSFSLLMTTQQWPWTTASSGGRTSTTRQRWEWFRRSADKLMLGFLFISWFWSTFRMWCSTIWDQAARRPPSSPIRRSKRKSLAPSPSYRSEVLGERYFWWGFSERV